MRIEANRRTNGVANARKADRTVGSGDFSLPGSDAPLQTGSLAPVGATASLDAVLALQGVEDATQAPRRAVRRGRSLLDTLDELRADLLAGRVDSEKLDRLAGLLSEGREAGHKELDALLDDIELRVRVELAKLGRYPDF